MGNLTSTSSSLEKENGTLENRITTAKATLRLRLLPKDVSQLDEILDKNPQLKGLKSLDLSKCNLKTLPHAIGTTLVKLQTLKLSDNPEIESLPVELANLKELRK